MNNIQSFLRINTGVLPQPTTILEVARLLSHKNDFSSSQQLAHHEFEVFKRITELYNDVKAKASKKQQVFISAHISSPSSNLQDTHAANFADTIMTMRGVAVAAVYLKQKHQIEHLYVCKSLEDFQIELEKFSQDPKLLKASFIICVRGYMHESIGFEARHKVAIGVEKLEGKLFICVFDPMNISTLGMNELSSILPASANDLEKGYIKPGLDLLWYIVRCKLDWENTVLGLSGVSRQKGGGCESFALRDAVCFMRNPKFSQETIWGSQFVFHDGRFEKAWIHMCVIDYLPPEFMKVSENTLDIEHYLVNHPLASRPLLLSSSSTKKLLASRFVDGENPKQYLFQSVLKHIVFDKKIEAIRTTTESTAHTYSDTKRETNLLIRKRSIKYHTIVALAFAFLPHEELNKQIEKTFCATYRSDFEKGQEPKTINDLHRLIRIKSRL